MIMYRRKSEYSGPRLHYFLEMDRYEDFLRLKIHLSQNIMYFAHADKNMLCFSGDNGQFDNGKILYVYFNFLCGSEKSIPSYNFPKLIHY